MKMNHFKYYSLLILLFISCTTSEPSPEAKKYSKIQKVIKEGNFFPTFSLPNQQGSIITDKVFTEGNVFYMFWGTWCTSCIDNIVAIRDMKKQGLLKNVKFVSISVDKDTDRWKQFMYQYDMTDYMDNVLLGKDRENTLSGFMFKEYVIYSDLITKFKLPKYYNYITPAYALVKDGKITSNDPVLPKDKEKFLNQFK